MSCQVGVAEGKGAIGFVFGLEFVGLDVGEDFVCDEMGEMRVLFGSWRVMFIYDLKIALATELCKLSRP